MSLEGSTIRFENLHNGFVIEYGATNNPLRVGFPSSGKNIKQDWNLVYPKQGGIQVKLENDPTLFWFADRSSSLTSQLTLKA